MKSLDINRLLLLLKRYGVVTYSTVIGIAAAIGSGILVYIAIFIGGGVSIDTSDENMVFSIRLVDYLGLILVAPLIESFLLILLLKKLRSNGNSEFKSCCIASMIFSGFHFFISPLNFFGTLWSFFLYSKSYFVWVSHSRYLYFLAVCLPHMLVNGLSIVIIQSL